MYIYAPRLMNILDVDFNLFALEQLPPDKRFEGNVALVQALIAPLQTARDLLLDSYANGSNAPAYDATKTYARKEYAIYGRSIYQSLLDNNTTDIQDVNGWDLVQENYIGIKERLKYNGQKIVLEYALNKWYGATFRQPGNGVSDIYLSTQPRYVQSFLVGGTEAKSSLSYANGSSEYVLNQYVDITQLISLIIYFPVAVYNTVGPDEAARQGIIRSFCDRYIYAGITYKVLTY